MKKLMLTSAIAGLALTASAIAQTTITGEIRVSHKAIGSEVSSGSTTTSGRGFGTEQQINFANKGKLNVGGLDYAAGFSIENDGSQTTTLFNENSYIDIINASSGTTLSFSVDHIQRNDSDRSAGNIFGFAPSEFSSGGHTSLMSATPGPGVGQSQSVAVIQDIGKFGKLAYNYAPTTTVRTDGSTTGSGSSETFTETNEKSAYEISFVGNLGVQGLTVDYFTSKQEKMVGQAIKSEGENIGVRYNTGALTLGVARKIWNDDATTNKVETTEKNYGIAYAVNKDVTLGLLHSTAENNIAAGTAGVVTQKLTAIQLGYNLGPVALTVGVARNTDLNGVAGQDSDMLMTRLVGAF
jgi:Gram-negative porin